MGNDYMKHKQHSKDLPKKISGGGIKSIKNSPKVYQKSSKKIKKLS